MEETISLKGLISLNLVKKEAYYGSHRGMRFRLFKEGEELMATEYPEPYSWDATAQELKTSAAFPLSEEGLEQAVAWLNEQYEQKYSG